MQEVDDEQDPFWQLIEPLLLSEFPAGDLQRVLGFVQHATGRRGLTDDIINDKWRPHGDIHAFMEDIPATPFRDTSAFPFVAELEERYEDIQVLCVTHAHACMHVCVSGGARGAAGAGRGAVSVSDVDEL